MARWHIAVLWHERERQRDLSQYVMTHLAEHWRDDGHAVRFVFGTSRYEPADVVVVHVNLSVVPDRFLEFATQFPVAVNGRVRDIRRTAFSRNLVGPDDDYAGPVIVKSNANHAGRPERYLRSFAATRARIARRIPHPRSRPGAAPVFRSPLEYRILDRAADVPRDWFDRPDIVVERFLPERAGDGYAVRNYHFLGDRASCTRMIADTPIVDSHTQVRAEPVEPHPEIERLRHELGFDYGKFDYVMHDGAPVLLDTNKTTAAAKPPWGPEILAERRHRADGLYSYLTRAQASA